jgi:hypothetical protein
VSFGDFTFGARSLGFGPDTSDCRLTNGVRFSASMQAVQVSHISDQRNLSVRQVVFPEQAHVYDDARLISTQLSAAKPMTGAMPSVPRVSGAHQRQAVVRATSQELATTSSTATARRCSCSAVAGFTVDSADSSEQQRRRIVGPVPDRVVAFMAGELYGPVPDGVCFDQWPVASARGRRSLSNVVRRIVGWA